MAATARHPQAAITHFERALEANCRAGARRRAALTRWRLAERLDRSGRPGDRERAAALLATAHDEAAALGLAAFATELHAAAAALHVSA